MTTDSAILETYRWHRALGQKVRQLDFARIVADPAHPNVWDTNHADCITAATRSQIDAVLESLEVDLVHSDWRVVHTDPQTPEPFLARLAFDGFQEQAAIIQMVLKGRVRAESAKNLQLVSTDGDWTALCELVRYDHSEGLRLGDAVQSHELTDGIVAGYKSRSPACQFYLAYVDEQPVGYGSCALGPAGAAIIEDLFTLPKFRRRGIASGMIAAFGDQLNDAGCATIFLGALVGQNARFLYSKLGFEPVMITRTWARRVRQPTESF
jgi:GNAT superfamily N-acetyltransferase